MFYVFDDELKSIEIEEISKNMLCAGFMTVGEFERLAAVFSLPKNIVELCKKDSDKNFLTKFLNDDLIFLRLNIMCNNNKNNEIALIVMKNMIMAVDIYDEFSFNQKCFLNALSNCACESVTAEKLICSFLEIIAKQCSANYNEEEDISALEKAVIDKNVSDNFGKLLIEKKRELLMLRAFYEELIDVTEVFIENISSSNSS